MENIETVKKIKEKYGHPKNVNVVHKESLSRIDNLAVFVTERIGTMGFFFLIFIWTILWLSWNIFTPKTLRFDPFPAFVLWLFISNLIQLHLMPLIMIGQNIQGRHAELRAEHDFETDKKAEEEIETILLRLEEQQKLLIELNEKISKLEKK
jgi:uncharacterized membrane protein